MYETDQIVEVEVGVVLVALLVDLSDIIRQHRTWKEDQRSTW